MVIIEYEIRNYTLFSVSSCTLKIISPFYLIKIVFPLSQQHIVLLRIFNLYS